jgi:hypothetical protein
VEPCVGLTLLIGLTLWVGAAADVGVPAGACDVGTPAGAELPWEGRVGLLLEDGMPAVPLYRPVDAGDGVPVVPDPGEKIAGMDEEGPAVQAETDAERSTVAVAQPAAVSLTLLTLMRPPCTRQAAA